MNSRQQQDLKYLRKSGLANHYEFAMWIRVPFSRSKRAWAAVAYPVVAIPALLIINGTLWWPGMVFMGLLVLAALFGERKLLAWSPTGADLDMGKAKFADDDMMPAEVQIDVEDESLRVNGDVYTAKPEDIATLHELTTGVTTP